MFFFLAYFTLYNRLLNCGVGENSWESLELQRHQSTQFWRKSVLNIHWKDGCWSWNSNTLATWCEELTHWKRFWCWERFKAGGEGDNRGWDGWIASPTQWTWVWLDYGSWWWTGRPGVLQSMGRKESDMTKQLNVMYPFLTLRQQDFQATPAYFPSISTYISLDPFWFCVRLWTNHHGSRC